MIYKIFFFLKYYFFWNINKKYLKKIKLLALDVDGVLTNGSLFYIEGKSIRSFNTKDGLGIKLLQTINIEIALISGGNNEGTLERANALGIKNVFFGVKNKSETLIKVQQELGIKANETIYIGDDLNDLVVKPHVKFLFATSDASKYFKLKSDMILKSPGGQGAVRELSDNLLISKNYLKKISKNGWIETN